jgi:hypothetical protein
VALDGIIAVRRHTLFVRLITTHYSQAELTNLIAAAENVCEAENSRKPPATTWLRRRITAVSL